MGALGRRVGDSLGLVHGGCNRRLLQTLAKYFGLYDRQVLTVELDSGNEVKTLDNSGALDTADGTTTVTVVGGATSVTVVVAQLVLDFCGKPETNVTEVRNCVDVTTDGASEENAVLERATLKRAAAATSILKMAIVADDSGSKRVWMELNV